LNGRYYLYRCAISSTMDGIIKIYSREVRSIFVSEISKYYTRTWNRLYLFYSYAWKQHLFILAHIDHLPLQEIFMEINTHRVVKTWNVFKRHTPFKIIRIPTKRLQYNYLFYCRVFFACVRCIANSKQFCLQIHCLLV